MNRSIFCVALTLITASLSADTRNGVTREVIGEHSPYETKKLSKKTASGKTITCTQKRACEKSCTTSITCTCADTQCTDAHEVTDFDAAKKLMQELGREYAQ